MQSTFLAWMFRMPLIKRWALMFCVKPENVAEHSHQVAIVAHLLAVIKNEKFGANINADKVATVALYHEASETRFGDIVSPTKYANPEIAREFKKIEYIAEKQCLESLPEEFQAMFSDIIVQDNVDHEFDHVKERLELKLATLKMQMPEVEYFMSVFIKSCSATVDKLTEVQIKK